MGDEKEQALSMHGLRSARGFIQSQIADRLELRYTPILSFVLDPGVKLSAAASAIIRDALPTAAPEGAGAGEPAHGEHDADAPADDAGEEADSCGNEAHESD
jgi:ribosome-binding factor A